MKQSLSVHPLVQLFLARVREFLRQPEAVFWAYVFPLVMVIALGLAFRSEPVEAVSVAVQEGPLAEATADRLRSDKRFIVSVHSEEEVRRRLRVGRSELIVIADETPAGPGYTYLFDPTRPGSVLARNTVDDTLQREAGRQDVAETRDEQISEPGSRYIDFLVPGLLGLGLMGGGVWGVGFAIVDMRIRQLLKRFVGTPMKKSHFVASMMLSRMVFMVPEIVVLLAFSRLLFGVTNHGSYWLVGLLVVLGAFEFAGIGLLIASRAKTLESFSGLMNLVLVPMWIGSGIFFSAERFPAVVQPVIAVMPLTPLIAALRSVMQEGAGMTEILPQLSLVAAWGAITFVLSLKLFRWE
ncbi:MAG: ABC transporter permease [Planctomycetaceae bacterium]